MSATPPSRSERKTTAEKQHSSACLLQETRASQTLLSLGQCSGWSGSAVAVPPPPVRHAHAAAGCLAEASALRRSDRNTHSRCAASNESTPGLGGRGGALGSCPPRLRSGRAALPLLLPRVAWSPGLDRTNALGSLLVWPPGGRHRVPFLGQVVLLLPSPLGCSLPRWLPAGAV